MTAPVRRAGWCAGLVLLLVTGCGAAGSDSVLTTSDVRAAARGSALPGPALAACGRARPLVDATLTDVTALVGGARDRRAGVPALAAVQARVQAEARTAGDASVEHALQDVADALSAYVAVGDRLSTGAYDDVVADALGTLRGFAATCPVRDPGFTGRTSDWTPATPATALALVADGHDGAGALSLRNATASPATVGAAAPRDTVASAGRSASYRVGLWARSAGADGAVLTLTVRERAAGGQVLRTQQVDAVLSSGWVPLELTTARTARGSSLDLAVSVPAVPAGGAVQLDDVALARD